MKRIAGKIATMSMAIALHLLCGCRLQHEQTMLSPAGPMSRRIETLWWVIFWISAVVFVLVVGFIGAAARRRTSRLEAPDIHPDPALEQRRLQVVIAALTVTVVILFSILGYSVVTGKQTNPPSPKSPVSIRVIGHQWWWEVQYPNPDVSQWVVTANEIHVPVGVPVVMETSSSDVIHSFWAPNVQGKRDLIPGYNNAFSFEVDRPGRYRGQCAEFCGLQHAHMGFYIIAESPDKFQAWLNDQVKPAVEPNSDITKRGQQVFLSTSCILCHTIRGTTAGSRLGPDLTHVGSRTSIGAATLPNTPGGLGGWIANPPAIKPGVRMPPNPLPAPELQALVAYLMSLQ